MNWNSMWDKTKTATKTTVNAIKTIDNHINIFEHKHFGNLDEKLDMLYDKWGNIIATKTKGTKEWTIEKFTKLHKEENNDIQ